MRLTPIVLVASLITAPVLADTVVIQQANPGAAQQAGGAAYNQHAAARADMGAAHNAGRAANIDAAQGNYPAAAGAQRRANADLRAGRLHNAAGARDASQARQDDSTRITVTP